MPRISFRLMVMCGAVMGANWACLRAGAAEPSAPKSTPDDTKPAKATVSNDAGPSQPPYRPSHTQFGTRTAPASTGTMRRF